MKETLGRQISLLGIWSVAVAFLLLLLFSCEPPANVQAGTLDGALSPTSPPALPPSGPLTLTHQVYVPLIDKTSPPIAETLKTRYLFVEHWVSKTYSQECPWSAGASLPVYSFDSTTGILTIYPPGADLILQAGDIGYIGAGASSGYWFANYLYRFQEIPFSANGVTLDALDDAGFVSLEYLGEAIALAPGASWLSSTVSSTPEITPCLVTTTARLTNYGFQHRDRIEYYSPP